VASVDTRDQPRDGLPVMAQRGGRSTR